MSVILMALSIAEMVTKAQHEPQEPCFFTGVMARMGAVAI
jgi:hypothetical protein